MSFIHANDAAMSDLGYTRIDLDFYPTPEWVTEAAVGHIAELLRDRPGASIWEPACGNGAMSEVLLRHFPSVISTDVADYGYGRDGVDFLATEGTLGGVIVTNPPYSEKAEEFIRHALRITRPVSGAVVMLLRQEYDCASSRTDLFEDPPFWRRITLTTRPRWIAGSKGSPRHNYAWFCWDWRHTGPATVAYHVRTDSGRKTRKKQGDLQPCLLTS